MFKITLMVSLMLIGTLYAARLSCDACGDECLSACGTRRFRTCCFNYLRKKRGHEDIEFWSPKIGKIENLSKPKAPHFFESIPDIVSNDYKPYHLEDILQNGLQSIDV